MRYDAWSLQRCWERVGTPRECLILGDDVTLTVLIDAVQREVMLAMEGQQAGHGVDHVQRVVSLALQLQRCEGGNRTIIALAAWLHDVGDAKFCDGVERGAELSAEILQRCAAPPELIQPVVEVVDTISFRKAFDRSQLSWEAKIVQDADRLEALGAIGIVRTIEYGAHRNRPFYLPGEDMATSQCSLGHFYQKLFRLRGLMNTATARTIAERRELLMRQFVEKFLEEWSVAEACDLDLGTS